ncbi:MAG: TetR family transcriptional regulator, partial [Lachnospiraceae bacterium]|nr:TetR family transcriptional regulator [Candidatus Hippenecus merdae]
MPKIIKDAEGLIIKSGRKLFTGKDPRRFTTDRVARKSQMCKATLYKYIDSIDSLRK